MRLLENHIAVVTGAASGIGCVIAAGYAREGARMVLLDMNGKAAAEAAQEIRGAGGKAGSFVLDVTRRADCVAVAKEIADSVGPVLIWSTMPASPCVRHARRERGRDQRLGGHHRHQPHRRVQRDACVSVPLRAPVGRIVNIGSIQSFMHLRTPSSPAYTASKHGVLGFTRALAAELGKDGVRVNAIGPGFIETPLNEEVRASNPDLIKVFMDHTPLGRAGKPEDIVGPAVFLALGLVGLCDGINRDGGWRVSDGVSATVEVKHCRRTRA